MAFSNKVLEHLRPDSILVVLIRLLRGGQIFCIYLLRKFLLAVFTRKQTMCDFEYLALVAVWRVLATFTKMLLSLREEVVLELWEAEQTLDDSVHVTGVA